MRLATLLTISALLGAALGGTAGAASKEVVVLTSFPKELFEAYKQAFEQRTPGVKVIVKAAGAELAEARKLASSVPIDAKQASDTAVNAAFKDKPDVKSRMETEWDTAAKTSYAKARELSDSAAGRIR